MKSSKYFLPLITLLIIVINVFVMISMEDLVNRWVRFFSMFVFFLLFLSPRYYNKRGILLFILLLVSDALLINYEDQLFNALLFIVRSGIFLTLMGLVINRLRYLKINLFQVIVLILAIGLNISLLYMLVEMVPLEQSYTLSDFLFYVYGFSVIASVTAAVSFRNRFTNKSSIFLLGGVLSLVFSDLTYFIAFILGFDVFFLVDRTFNIVGIALLLQFFRLDIKERIVRSNEFVN